MNTVLLKSVGIVVSALLVISMVFLCFRAFYAEPDAWPPERRTVS